MSTDRERIERMKKRILQADRLNAELLEALCTVRTRCTGIFTTDQETGLTFDALIDAAIAKATSAATSGVKP